jgi:hypothetical protein
MMGLNYRGKVGGLAIREEKKRLPTPLISLIEVGDQMWYRGSVTIRHGRHAHCDLHHPEEGTMKLAAGVLTGVLAVMLGVNGCASSGASTGGGPATGQFLILNDQFVVQIKDGVSTKDDVKGLLGNPGGISTKKDTPDLPADMETWAYVATTQTEAHALVIIVKNGIVLSHNKNVQPIAR